MLAGIGENAGVHRHRPGLRRHVQGRVAQPPVVRRALPGRGHRRRRHRPRHPRDGRPPGRGDGPAALRPARRRRHPPGAARDRGRRRRLRQLPRPAQHRRRGGLRRDLRSATRWSTRSASACCATRTCTWPRRPASATRSSCTAPRTGGDGIGGVCVLASRDLRRRPARPSGPSVQVGDPFMEKLLIECTLELFAAGAGRRHPGPRRRRALLRDLRAGQRRRRRHARRARPGAAARLHARARGDPDERVAGADDGGRRARRRRRVPGDLREVGRRGRRDRRGHRRRPARRSTGTASASSTCRRGRSRTTARRTSARSPGPTGRTRSRPTAPRRCRGRRPATSCARPLLRLVASPEPLRQVLDHRPVRPLRAGQHRARPARGRRHDPRRRGDQPRRRGRHRLQRPVRQARPVRRRAARARRVLPQRRRPAAPRRSRSPTASTSARPRTRT